MIFLFISLQKMFESFPVPYSNVDMSQGLSNVFNQVKIFTLSKFYLVRLPNLLGPRESHSKCKLGTRQRVITSSLKSTMEKNIARIAKAGLHILLSPSCAVGGPQSPRHNKSADTYDNTHWGETI